MGSRSCLQAGLSGSPSARRPAATIAGPPIYRASTGFGIASRLLRERQDPEFPEVIAVTLAYMAPEQTGRMNRSIDARSDLYSLGVTLYQMLTGTLPFAAADPLEWIHCHIARQPAPPGERAAVPEPLSTITMKLLAKNAEERYQTAAGLEADLRRCLEEWETHVHLQSIASCQEELAIESCRLSCPLQRACPTAAGCKAGPMATAESVSEYRRGPLFAARIRRLHCRIALFHVESA